MKKWLVRVLISSTLVGGIYIGLDKDMISKIISVLLESADLFV